MKTTFLVGIIALTAIGTAPAWGDSIISVGSATVVQGGTGSLDVTITNSSGTPQNIAGFDFEISIPAISGIMFLGVNESTANTYIFDGDSLFGPNIILGGTGSTIDGSDISASGAGTSITSSTTFGLGHILFSVSGGAAAGVVTVSINPTSCATNPASNCFPTNLSDAVGNGVNYSTFSGLITVQAAPTAPEPSTLALMLLILPAAVFIRKRKHEVAKARRNPGLRCSEDGNFG